jgi:hypothetical protein
MSDEIKYPWQRLLLDAFTARSESLPTKIGIAQRAIDNRLNDEPDVSERLALIDALNALRVLIGETLPKPMRRQDQEPDKKKDIA